MEIGNLEPKTEINMKNEELFKAAEKGDSSLFKSLSESQLHKALSLLDEDGCSFLHVAASSGQLEVVNVILADDATLSIINKTDEEGWAPIHSAASIGNVDMVEALLNRGADVNLKNSGGRVALHYAASKGWVKMAETLISYGATL